MKLRSVHCCGGLGLLICLLFNSHRIVAQITPPVGVTAPNTPKKDTSKTNTTKWKDEAVEITYKKLNSARIYTPDTSIHTYQRAPFLQPWYRDLGNLGSPELNLMFTPENRVGPTLGYHVYDVFRYNIDDLNYYTTSRPYSVFSYELGSKLEQTAGIMHTQNIKPNWNFGIEYRKINSPGFYQVQRNNHDNANFTTNYKSLNKHYVLYAAVVYNNEQHDENGGIVDDSELLDPTYSDRKTVNVAYQNSAYSVTRSSVTNVQRDFTMLLQHSYLFGKTDTTFSKDSTQYTYKLKPVFGLTHRMEIGTEKHTFKDLTPDSTRYVTLFNRSFTYNTAGNYTAGEDSVLAQQKWFWIDNQILLNGFIGKADRPLEFSAGLGTGTTASSQPAYSVVGYDTLHHPVSGTAFDRDNIISNYFTGEIKKEALHPGEWEYGVNAKFFLTGDDAGNFVLNASMGRELKNNTGSFVLGIQQQVNSAPFNYTNYENNYTRLTYSFNNESVSMMYAAIESPRFRLSAGVRNYVIGNYIYLNDSEKPAQYTVPYSVSQVWLRKTFRLGVFFLDNELVYQQAPANAPVNIPVLMGRHQLGYERAIFKNALKIATGIEVRYNTKYDPAGYDALLNRFFYQNSTSVGNTPEASIFFNFRIKRFRAFIIGDNLQQMLVRQNTVTFVGTPIVGSTATPVYAAPDALIRFGFSWVMVN